MTTLSARSTLVNFTLTKKLTSNGSKPMGVLTRTECLCSDERLPISFLLCNFLLIWSNFYTSLPLFTTRNEGGRHVGGAPPPPNPAGGGSCQQNFWLKRKPRGRALIVTKQQNPIQFFTSSRKLWKGGGRQLIKTCLGTQATLCTSSSINSKTIKCWTKRGSYLSKILFEV